MSPNVPSSDQQEASLLLRLNSPDGPVSEATLGPDVGAAAYDTRPVDPGPSLMGVPHRRPDRGDTSTASSSASRSRVSASDDVRICLATSSNSKIMGFPTE